MRAKVCLVLGLVVMMSAGAGLALQWAVEALRVKIDFEFTVGTEVLPAGEYKFSLTDSNDAFRIEGGKEGALAPVMSRLSSDVYTSPSKSRLVFDVADGKYYLSEIWVPEADGFLISAMKGKHTHKVLEMMK